jgi:hypothetical protein
VSYFLLPQKKVTKEKRPVKKQSWGALLLVLVFLGEQDNELGFGAEPF